MKRLYKDHRDYTVLKPGLAIKLIWDELKEFKAEPSWDEFSDICYGINRLAGGLFGVKYIRILPFDNRHIRKCNHRFMLYGHFRSPRHR